MNIFTAISICIIYVSGVRSDTLGTLNKNMTFMVKRGMDEKVIYDESKGPETGNLWNVKIKVEELGSKVEVYITVRLANQVKSFTLPQKYRSRGEDLSFNTTRRIMDICTFDVETNSNLSISMSTDSNQNVEVQLKVGLHETKDLKGWDWHGVNQTFSDFTKDRSEETQMTLKLGSPVVKYVPVKLEKDEGGHLYNVDLTASDKSDCICSIVSIQKATCPFSDSLETSMRYGIWQTMLKKSTLIVDGRKYPEGFLVVVVASPSDELCQIRNDENKCDRINCLNKTEENECVGIKDHNELFKDITIKVRMNASSSDYVIGVVVVIFGYFFLLVVSLSISFIRFNYDIKSYEDLKEVLQERIPSVAVMTTEVDSQPKPAADKNKMVDLWNVTKGASSALKESLNLEVPMKKHESDESNKQESTANLFTEAVNDKTDHVNDHKLKLKVSELSQKLYDPAKKTSIYKKSTLYVNNLMLMSLFYCLPVLQMVKEANSQIDQTGNHDLCYFNHLCLKPLGRLKDFNHVFSNLGYIFLGLLFIGLVYIKEQRFLKLSSQLRHNFGVPQQFELFYAMGLALAMEGLLSACYHACPTTHSFQFDTTYMYLMAILMQMKIFQSRHPDNACSANLAFAGLGVALIFEALSLYSINGEEFWAVFCIIYFVVIVVVATHHYHIGYIRQDRYFFWNAAKLNFAELKKIYKIFKSNDWRYLRVKSRFIFLVIAIVINGCACLFIAISQKKSASNCLLFIFMGNMLGYLVYYVLMKLLRGEKLSWESWLYLVCGNLMAIPAMYFFLQKEKSTKLSPAESREKNRECILLNFYDGHDVWHFLGGGGVFFVFMFLLNVDEDLKYTRRDLIHVF